MSDAADIGVIGLGVMGRNLALNMAEKGFSVVTYDPWPEARAHFNADPEVAALGIRREAALKPFVAALKAPRAILLMVKAGDPVDDVIDLLVALLSAGDTIIDGGNSHYADTRRRERALYLKNIHFVGMGVSGGETGARHGPALMPGGSATAYDRLAPIVTAMAAQVAGRACVTHVGSDGAGHFVKMVHNGIEYADMQTIAEAYWLMSRQLGLSHAQMAAAFARFNDGPLQSYLIEITADILAATDPEDGTALVEKVHDAAGQKGTGMWTSIDALELGVAAPSLAEAVFARNVSALKDERRRADPLLAGPEAGTAAPPSLTAIEQALMASKICAYAQGFALIDTAARRYGWQIDPGALATIWRGGCIIRAQFLDTIAQAYADSPDLANLMCAPYFRERLAACQPGWRQVVGAAVADGHAIPVTASALSYYDAYRSGRLWANLIQAQRDCFGAHGYRRLDRDGDFHSDWRAAPG